MSRDRAAVATTSIVRIVTDAWGAWLHGDASDLKAVRWEIESLLRDEFSDCAREAREDLTLTD